MFNNTQIRDLEHPCLFPSCSSFGMHFGRHLNALHSRVVQMIKGERDSEVKGEKDIHGGRREGKVACYQELEAAAFT